MALLCIPIPRLVFFAFYTIPICPFLIVSFTCCVISSPVLDLSTMAHHQGNQDPCMNEIRGIRTMTNTQYYYAVKVNHTLWTQMPCKQLYLVLSNFE